MRRSKRDLVGACTVKIHLNFLLPFLTIATPPPPAPTILHAVNVSENPPRPSLPRCVSWKPLVFSFVRAGRVPVQATALLLIKAS